ncbi:MAG: transcription-repair coupling factor [Clostridia bacterium]
MHIGEIVKLFNNKNLVTQKLDTQDKVFVRGTGLGETAVQLSNIDAPQICLCADMSTAQDMADALNSLGMTAKAVDVPNEAFAVFKYASRKSLFELIKSLYDFSQGRVKVLCCTPELYVYPLPDRQEFLAHSISLGKDKSCDFDHLSTNLVANGYTRVEQVEDVGEFTLRGDILDIYPVGESSPIRVNFWGDDIESIYHMEQTTLSKLDELDHVDILPASLVYLTQNERESALKTLASIIAKRESEVSQYVRLSRDIELGSTQLDNNIISQLVDKKYVNLLTFTDNAIKVVYREFSVLEHLKKVRQDRNKKCKDMLGKVYSEIEDFATKQVIFDQIEKNADQLYIGCEVIGNYLTRFEDLLKKTKEYISWGRKVVFCVKTAEAQASIGNILREKGIAFSLDSMDSSLALVQSDFAYNIIYNDEKVVVIGSQNFAYRRVSKQKNTSTQVYLPKKGEYVVHNVHGIGYCAGVETIEALGAKKDYFKIIYRGDAVLYVPCENCDSLSLYMSGTSSEVKINKIGGQEFATATKKAMKSIKDMAKDLILLYSARAHNTRTPYPADDYLYTQFESAFKYEETPDQVTAIADIERDMHSNRIMDRLVCGDVGFGKTEVAFRAVFRAVLDNRQVAILAPTTVLSLQHYNSCVERFKDFGIRIEMLNRFKTKQETQEILDGLASGKVNVVCGTHRLLSKDVVFDNLGLLVLDEEHRFGVSAKEKIKQVKNSVDVLTLSATPIPRTLNMALMKIRDISILNTPPTDRKSIKTYVVQYDKDMIEDAIMREYARGGQTLIVCNNIDQLYALAGELRQDLKDIRFDVGHGQLPESQLEDAVHKLYNRDTDVFLSTTIIENGIDLPYANTMIVLDSQNLGLSQMYQLRGRVGRAKEQAYCFFTYPSDRLLTKEASERLEAIAEHTELGSGIKLAMRDLQLRGAGELLGTQQSGHIANIGYDMYIKLLEKATKELRGQEVQAQRDIKLDIAISATIPNDFCIDEVERLKIYNQIFAIDSIESQKAVMDKLRNLYGALPMSVVQLTHLAVIKHFGEKLGVKHIVINSNVCHIEYYEDKFDGKKVLEKLVDFAEFSIKNAKLPTISVKTTNKSVLDLQTAVIRWLVNFDKDGLN